MPALLPLLKASLPLPPDAFRFLEYHGQNDEHHLARWLAAVELALDCDEDGRAERRIGHRAPHRRALPDAVPSRDGGRGAMKQEPEFLAKAHDPLDPSPWLALYLDRSTPLPDKVKKAWLTDSSSSSRQYLLPLGRCARLHRADTGGQDLRAEALVAFEAAASHPGLGPEALLAAEANWLILRHFHLGAQILAFIAANSPVPVSTTPLEAREIDDLKDELFVKHDLNLFNFVIRLNTALREAGVEMRPSGSTSP